MLRATPAASFILPILLGAALLSGCTDANPRTDPVEFADIHGLAVDPTDPSVLYVATHHGLFQGVGDAAWSKVSHDTHDFMGFSIHPTDPFIMYASGHPENANMEYWALGVVKSTDGGRTWQTMALRNQVDFHAMAVSLAQPDTLWGHFKGEIYESTDAGASWKAKTPQELPARVFSLASSAADPTTLFAATEAGLLESRDAGGSWGPVEGAVDRGPAVLVATSRADAELLWAVFAASGPAHSEDGGASWSDAEPIDWGANDGPAAMAIDSAEPAVVYVASARGNIHKTTDEGGSWLQIQ